MKKSIKHYHFAFQGKNILCALEFEDHIKKYDVTIWCDNRYLGREKIKNYNREDLLKLVKNKVQGVVENQPEPIESEH
ncbi:MAG: hypothetical protein ACR2GN_06315 [Bacteroidia bacterium]